MKNLVGLTGTHGTGKSTILKGVADSGHRMNGAQLSRTAQKNLGWSELARAGDSLSNMWALQDSIIEALELRDNEILMDDIPTIAERSPADLWGYTKMWLRRFNVDYTTDKRALEYRQKCLYLAERYSLILVVPVHDRIPFVSDPNRATIETRNQHQADVLEFIKERQINYHILETVDRSSRIVEACDMMTIINKFPTRKTR